ncbi:MAG: transglycosylase domain-containing protein [bacterium]|nr:transglycosylase domain-containing protein [bacterium]
MPHERFHRPYSPGDWRGQHTPPRDRARTRRNQRRTRRIFGTIVLLAVAALLVGSLSLAVLLAVASRNLPDPTRLIQRTVPQSTKIYDRTGEHLLYEVHRTEKRTWRALDDIAQTAKWAAIAIEDRAFYEHHGFRFRSFVRALLANVLSGSASQGGSTITQQLVKNAILTPEKTYSRKLRELILSYQIEQKFTKDQILTLYLNEIPYGANAYGIEAAAQTFLGKSANALDLAESAMLAALPKAPTRLSPHGSHTDELKARTRLVLDLMAAQGYITSEEATRAKAVEILARVKPRREAIVAPHFVMYVRELLTERYGERMVEEGGLKVTTTLDSQYADAADAAIAKTAKRNMEKYDASNAALVAIDVPTGQILTMVGSVDFFDEKIDGQVNVAVRPRQPGSSFKPIVYAAAFRKGYTTETLLEDVATTFPTPVGAYEPKNYDGKERGLVTIRKALAGSLNIPAVKALYLAGIDDVLDLADRLGYTTLRERSRFGLALVLGGGEVKLLEHTAAYAALAADGIRRPIAAILKVEDAAGNVLEEWKPSNGERALDEGVVRSLTSILTDNAARTYVFGATSPLAFTDRAVAAKTGTTNDWRDAWTMGYTPSLAVGVWVGNNDNRPMKQRSDGSFVAAPIWRAFLDTMLKGKPAETFAGPPPIVADKPVLRGEDPGIVRVRIDRTTGKRATTLTPPELVEEREYRTLHTILHYVRRDDPLGATPERPEDDPMYRPWEDALAAWAVKNKVATTAPPAEEDDVHTEGNRPTLTIAAPAANSTITGRDVLVEGIAAAPRGITRIEAHVDGVAAALFAPTNGSFRHSVHLPATIGRGTHELRVTAYDDVGNNRSVTVPIDVASDREAIALTWEQPADGASLRVEDFPVTLAVRATAASGANRLEIHLTDTAGTQLLTSVVPQATGETRVLWLHAPAPGTITLRARLLANDTLLAESGERRITVARSP